MIVERCFKKINETAEAVTTCFNASVSYACELRGISNMNDARLFELLVKLHAGLPRLGPGSREATLEALSLCHDLPNRPMILDVGCGSGAQTLVLASASRGRILATDLVAKFIGQLQTAIQQNDLHDQVRAVRADMNALPFPANSFNLIWSEGAIYIMGFDNGLRKWRSFLKPDGYLVVSEMVWFRSDAPTELRDYWELNYPSMRGVEANLAAARKLGWMPEGNFHLPFEAWAENYHAQLKARLPVFRANHKNDPCAQTVADMTEHEISLMQHYRDYCGYEFFVLRRQDHPK